MLLILLREQRRYLINETPDETEVFVGMLEQLSTLRPRICKLILGVLLVLLALSFLAEHDVI